MSSFDLFVKSNKNDVHQRGRFDVMTGNSSCYNARNPGCGIFILMNSPQMSNQNPAAFHKKKTFGLMVFIILMTITACSFPQVAAPPTVGAQMDQVGIMNVYFTDPDHQREGTLPSEALKDAFSQAGESIDLAIYNFNDPVLAKSLIQAHKRGVNVRVVMEDENAGKSTPFSLQAAGIPLVAGNEDGLMHNKFAIIDGSTLWMGSTNFTTYGFYTDNNYFVEISDPDIASIYQGEFNEMFVSGLFGAMALEPSSRNEFSLQESKIEIYFSPEDHISSRLIDLVENAGASVHFLTSSFTLDDLATAMLEKSYQGVEVKGVFDESSVSGNEGTEYDRLRRAGLDIRLDGIQGLMHEKLMIIDDSIVAIGSYNYTASAENRNDENIMIIYDDDLARLFEAEFQRILDQSQP